MMSKYFLNSLLVAGIKVPLGVIIVTLSAFALTRMNFRYSNTFFIILLLGMMLPIHVALVPLTTLLNITHLLDTYQGLIITYLGFGIPFGIFLTRGYFKTIPYEIDDSAKIDGCSDFSRYWRIILPLATPVIATLIIIDFLDTWNEFIQALLFMRSDAHRTIPIGLINYRDRNYSDYTLMNAGVLISAVPVTIIYLAFQKYFISGIAAGAIKG